MSSIAPDVTESVTITRDNANAALAGLLDRERQIMDQICAATSLSEHAELFRRAAANLEQQARAWETGPGHNSRDTQATVDHCRRQAYLCSTTATIEDLRAAAAEWGIDLPDPRVFLDEDTVFPIEALIRLYTAAAGGPLGERPSDQPAR